MTDIEERTLISKALFVGFTVGDVVRYNVMSTARQLKDGLFIFLLMR